MGYFGLGLEKIICIPYNNRIILKTALAKTVVLKANR